ncbi:MAG: SDR family NAD(P)-dependent oxidoreductase [Solirubrobacterales bacterium]
MSAAYDLDGKVVFVTGGAKGIGFETARQAAALGAAVAICDLDLEACRESAEAIGPEALALEADVTEPEALERAFTTAVTRFGRVDVVVANAGVAPKVAPVLGMPEEEWERVIQTNLFGVYNTVVAGMEQVIANSGQFVLVSSSYAFMNGVLSSPYATAKAGVEALGRALRAELLPRGASATVAYFGWIATDMVETTFSDPVVDRFRREAVPRPLTRRVPVSRAGRVIVEGIGRRSPRVIAPFEWKALFYLRGLLGPFMDRRFENDPRVAEIVLEAEARAASR